MRKLIDGITLISALLTLTMTGGVLYSYFYITNPENQEKTKGFVMKEIKKMLPDVMPEMPTETGKAIPIKPL
tara:strand:+ start:287 stop:502 length:216 start_codon:yes stop_codon:yes gene_type:complete